jgi:hypothetical protein
VLAAIHLNVQAAWPFLLLPVAVGLAWFGYRATTPPLPPGRRGPLIALRSLAYALLLLVLASPILNRMRNEPMRARIAVLVDESASMSSSEPAGAASRLERARGLVRSLDTALGGDAVDLEVVPFSSRPEPPLAPGEYLEMERQATGAGTDLVGALRATADRLAGTNLQALVLLSDGRPTQGGLDASVLAGLGRPVFAVGLGDTLAGRDLAIGRCEYSQVAYVESEAEIAVRIENAGFRGRSTTLRLLQGGRELFQRRIDFEQDHARTSLDVPLRFDTPGRQRYRLVLDPLPEESTEKNNTREISIEVLKNKIRVLVVAARPDWDVGFLARTLRDDANVQVTVVHLNSDGAWVRDDGAAFTLPQGARVVQDWDLYVVAAPGSQPAPLWRELPGAVERGKGLLLLAGRESALASAAPFEALAPALPVTRGRGRAVQYRVQGVRLAPQGRHHPATTGFVELADAGGALAALTPVLGQHPEVAPKPGALVLLSTDGETSSPLLVSSRHGQGQTAVLTGFPIWRWGLAESEPVRQAARSFVGNLVRWLTQPRDVQPVQIATSKTVYESGEEVDFLAHVLDAQYAPLDDAEVRLEVRRLDGERDTAGTLLLERRAGHPGEYAATLPGLGPGEYEARIVASRQGVEVGRDTARFTVDAYSAEFADTSQDIEFLRELAQRTGGRYAAPEELPALAVELPRAPRPVVLRSEIEIWNTTPMFLLFVVVMSAEWLLRKRYGLL